ncbi:hypothetical protein BLX87_19540 [Bacillus sp. VT-16-64]|nr:hypothetical protein BLX87_19540 [Bacillus sp. VT-16-64]
MGYPLSSDHLENKKVKIVQLVEKVLCKLFYFNRMNVCVVIHFFTERRSWQLFGKASSAKGGRVRIKLEFIQFNRWLSDR